ncbi:MAG TPA: hypothetical protein VMC85_19585 [Desulfomonilaceae bacterium]|nr:hypothetical protein [Desulfomonilaceae bacterium]
MDSFILSMKALVWLFGVLFGAAAALAMVNYIVRRLGGCIPGKISCR